MSQSKNKSRYTLLFILIITSIILGLYSIQERINRHLEEITPTFEEIVHYHYEDSYQGVVSNKYFDSLQHNYRTVVVSDRKLRLDYEWLPLFDFIQIGDSIKKQKKSLDIRLKRHDIDTVIRLNFNYLKYDGNRLDFLYNLDSIYDK